MEKLIITPRTKIYDLLEAYPELEDVLIGAAPEFKKLKNPVLRRTIARVTSISQAAIVGGVNVENLVNLLREKAGQNIIELTEEPGHSYNKLRPEWYRESEVIDTIDIREMLNRGEQPVHEVLSALNKLNSGQIIKISAPFIPAPLLDKSIGLGYLHWLNNEGKDGFSIYFAKEQSKSR